MPSQPLGWMHVCYEAGDLNALQQYYASEGLNPAPVRKAAAGNLITSINDPDNRVTEFTQYMPGSRHTLDMGQHLGAGRISTELMGIDLPVREGAAMKEFYTDLGFEAEDTNGNVRLTTPGAPDLHMELRAARPWLAAGVPLSRARREECIPGAGVRGRERAAQRRSRLRPRIPTAMSSSSLQPVGDGWNVGSRSRKAKQLKVVCAVRL